MSDIKTQIELKIKDKKVVVYSKTYCPYCTKAKKALAKYNIKPEDIEIIEIENDPKCNEIQDALKAITGARSVPRVFINGKCIGGGDETAAADSRGQLKTWLA